MFDADAEHVMKREIDAGPEGKYRRRVVFSSVDWDQQNPYGSDF